MLYGELDPQLGDKIISVQDYVAEMSSQTALGDLRRKYRTQLTCIRIQFTMYVYTTHANTP